MRFILFLPLAALVMLFALSNQQVVDLRLWPFDLAWEAPLSVAVLAGSALAFLLGAGLVWVADLPARRRGRSAQRQAERLQREVDGIRAAEKRAAADRLAGGAA